MLDLAELGSIFQAIKAVAASDPDPAVQSAANEVLDLLDGTRQSVMKNSALLIFNDTTKPTNARTRNLSVLRRLLLKHNVRSTGTAGEGQGQGVGGEE